MNTKDKQRVNIKRQRTRSVCLPVVCVQACLPGPVLTVGLTDQSSGVIPLLFISAILVLLHLEAGDC